MHQLPNIAATSDVLFLLDIFLLFTFFFSHTDKFLRSSCAPLTRLLVRVKIKRERIHVT